MWFSSNDTITYLILYDCSFVDAVYKCLIYAIGDNKTREKNNKDCQNVLNLEF